MSNDLISRNKTLEKINKMIEVVGDGSNFNARNVLLQVADAVMFSETAYKLDKVVEQLLCESINTGQDPVIRLDRAIEIVKGGGMNEI